MELLKGYIRLCRENTCSTCPFKTELEIEKCQDFILKNSKKAEEIIREWLVNNPIEIDWRKVPVDTKVLVRDTDEEVWKARYFALYAPNTSYSYYTFSYGENRESSPDIIGWRQCKLPDDVDPTPYLLK